MFKITKSPEFTHVVTVLVPVDGGHDEQTFKARFRAVLSTKAIAADVRQPEGFLTFLREIIVSLDDLADERGTIMTYNDDVRERLLAYPYVRIALLKTYTEALNKARLGN